MPEPLHITGLSQIARDYDALICDIWGVVHDGRAPYENAVGALQEYRREKGRVVLLSNAPRLSSDVARQLEHIGIARDTYDVIVTSGEATRADLAPRAEPKTLAILHIGPPRDNGVFDGLNVRLTNGDEADIVLCTGLYDDEREGPEDYRGTLETLAAHELTMLCANPDVQVQRGPRLIYCAGAIARLYESMGGTVVYYGKPHAPVFHAAIAEARALGAAGNVLVIGDNMDTDIRGANGLDLDALFVAGGVHAGTLSHTHESVQALLAHAKVHVRGWMAALAW